MKIALISTPMIPCPAINYGGLEQVVFDLACGLAELGHKVVVFATKGSEIPPKGFLVECCEPELKVQTDWLSAERKMWGYYRGYLEDFDIIHSHTWFGFAYASKVKNPQLKICQTMHGGINLDWWKKSPSPFKLNMVAISDWMVKIYASQGFTAKRVYNGINLEKYKLQKKKGNRILFLSRISKIKAPHVAIEVAKKANMGLDVVGATNFVDDPAYVQYVKDLCDGEKIKFVGEVSHEDKLRYLQNARGLIVPGRWGEPFGLHVIEAMAVGTSVLAFPDGGIAETVKQGGILCSDVDSMVSSLSELSRITPAMCRKNAELFSRERCAENYLKLYYDIISGVEW